MRPRTHCIFAVVFCSYFATASWAQTESELINLVAEYDQALKGETNEAVKCGFPAVAALRSQAVQLSKFDRVHHLAAQRPVLPLSYVTPDGRFRFHYTTSGNDAVDPAATIDRNVPDFVYEAGQAAQLAHTRLLNSLGFRPPVDDGGVDGPEFDFYILNLNNLYGDTQFDFSVGTGPAFIRLDNDYQGGGFYSKGLDGLLVTVAHEYFHAVQLNYYFRNEDVFFFELSSVWFEDFSYDDINDYLQYLPSWFLNFTQPLNSTSGFRQYGSSLWLHYLIKRLGSNEIVSAIWERLPSQQAVYAMSAAIEAPPFNFSFGEAIREFQVWTYFTGSRADTVNYFEEGHLYPELEFRETIRFAADTSIADDLASLAGRFYRFHRDRQELSFRVLVDSALRWRASTIAEQEGAFDLQEAIGLVTLTVDKSDREDSVVVLVSNVGLPPSALDFPKFNYTLRGELGNSDPPISALEVPHPNPFRLSSGSIVQFPYSLKERTQVSYAIFREDGSTVIHKNLGERGGGRHTDLWWDGVDESGKLVGSGIYLFRLLAGSLVETAKFVVVRN